MPETSEHRMQRQAWASEIETLQLTDDGNLRVTHSEQRGPVRSEETLECTCGREFEDYNLAAEHLRSVGADTIQTPEDSL